MKAEFGIHRISKQVDALSTMRIDPGGGGDLLANCDTITDTNWPTDIMDLISKYVFGNVGGDG